MPTLRVFDPPMCCSSGVCGPEVDPALVQFASDLRAATARGLTVVRFNLSQEPEAFVAEPAVRTAIGTLGTAALPIVILDGGVMAKGRYPTSEEMAALDGAEPGPGLSLEMAPTACCASGSCG